MLALKLSPLQEMLARSFLGTVDRESEFHLDCTAPWEALHTPFSWKRTGTAVGVSDNAVYRLLAGFGSPWDYVFFQDDGKSYEREGHVTGQGSALKIPG